MANQRGITSYIRKLTRGFVIKTTYNEYTLDVRQSNPPCSAAKSMVDIHSHIVWGLDDGATDIEQSLSMLRAAAESGTTDIVATPHSNAEFVYQRDLVDQRIRELGIADGGQAAHSPGLRPPPELR